MKSSNLLIFLLSICCLCACSIKSGETVQTIDAHFDLSALLDQQIEGMKGGKATLEKVLTSGETREDLTTIDPDSTKGWKRQLELFYEADINKPGFVGAYFQEELPAINGTSKVIYTAKSQKYPVQVMECIYVEASLKEIRLLVEEVNSIYSVIKEMNLYFDNDQRLTGFSIDGDESMTLKKDLKYNIQGTVIYKSQLE